MYFAAIVVSLISFSFCECNVEFDGWLNVRLQHSLGLTGPFTERGNITVQSVRSGTYSLEQPPLAPEQSRALRELARTGGYYRLRSIAHTPDAAETVFLSTIKCSTLLDHHLHDILKIWILNDGAVAGVSLSPTTEDLSDYEGPAHSFTSQVLINHIEQAPVPDTASYIQKLEREREAREKGEFKDNRSFLAKYWMYIVPVVIFVILSGAANPEQGGAR